MPSKEDWAEVRRGVPPSEFDLVPDDSLDYEAWADNDGETNDGLTIYRTAANEYILVRSQDENRRIIDTYDSYEEVKEELEEQKEQEW